MAQSRTHELNKAMPKGAKATSIDSSKTVTDSYPGGMKIHQSSEGQNYQLTWWHEIPSGLMRTN